jgi:hypothetical protein
VIAKDHVTRSWNWIRAETARRKPSDIRTLIEANVAAAVLYFNANSAARKTLFGASAFELHVVESNFDVMSAQMFRELIKAPDWPVEPLSEEDPFRTVGLVMSVIFAASVRRSDRITPEMAEQAKLAALGYLSAREAAWS